MFYVLDYVTHLKHIYTHPHIYTRGGAIGCHHHGQVNETYGRLISVLICDLCSI